MLFSFGQSGKRQDTQKLRVVLMLIACGFVVIYGFVLSLAPSVRTHDASAEPLWQHWIGIVIWIVGVLSLTIEIKRSLPASDPYVLPITALLSGLGMLTVWRLSPALGVKQTIWLALGVLIIILGLRVNTLLEFLQRYKYFWLTLGLLLTFLTLIWGVNPYGAHGPRLWLRVLNFYFQPSEPLKLLMIVYLAAYFAHYNPAERRFFASIVPTLIMAILALLILVIQRDLGTASIMVLIYAVMLMVTTQRRRLLWIVPLLFIGMALTAYASIDIVKVRVDTWLNPWQNTSGPSYQIIQSLIAIASGGFFGTGPGLGSPGLVPVAVSDFVFSAIAEELGLLGTSVVILIFLILSIQSLKISLQAKSGFNRYLALGISVYFTVQTILIIGGNLGMLPLTGITLPFLSYGGSSLVTNFVCILLLLKISKEDEELQTYTIKSKSISRLGLVFSGLFFAVILINGYIVLVRGNALILRDENSRWSIYDRYIPRGNILDSNETLLVETIGESGAYQRNLPHVPLSNTIGYTNAIYGQSGLESSLYPYLRGLSGLSFNSVWWHQRLYSQPPAGLDIKLTLNLRLQKTVDDILGDSRGAVVLMNAKTGELYVLASHPYFDANAVEDDWEELINDPRSPFLNRATQGSYPLGTANNSLLLTLFAENYTESYTPPNTSSKLDSICSAAILGEDTSIAALQAGCNQANYELASKLSSEELGVSLNRLGFNSSYEFPLPLHIPSPPIEQLESIPGFFLDETNFLVSPIQMARFAAVLTNEGELPVPLLTNSYKDEFGKWISFPLSESGKTVLTPNVTDEVKNLLQAGSASFWYGLGHATDLDGQIITWYIGGTLPDWQGSPLAIAMVLEENNPQLAIQIGEQLLKGQIQ